MQNMFSKINAKLMKINENFDAREMNACFVLLIDGSVVFFLPAVEVPFMFVVQVS